MDRGLRDDLQRDLVRLADGDRDAFHSVFVRAWPVIRGFVGRQLPAEDAEDAAQEALVRVFRRAAEFDVRQDALSWVLGIAFFEVRTVRRRRQRRREVPLAAEDAFRDAGADPEQALLARDREDALQAALAALPPLDAQTLAAFAGGLRPSVAPATFRKRVQRALERLRAIGSADHGRG